MIHYHMWGRGLFVFGVWTFKEEAKLNSTFFLVNTININYVWMFLLSSSLTNNVNDGRVQCVQYNNATIKSVHICMCVCMFYVYILELLWVEIFEATTFLFCKYMIVSLCVWWSNHVYYISTHCCFALLLSTFS
jgi:hypothetical protein